MRRHPRPVWLALPATPLPLSLQVMIVALPVILLESFRDERPPWSAAGWRIACVGIGVGVEIVVITLFFPVTTGALMRQRLQGALRQLAALAQGVAACQAGGQGDGPGAAADGATAAKLEAGQQLAGSYADAGAAERLRLQAVARQVGEAAPARRWRPALLPTRCLLSSRLSVHALILTPFLCRLPPKSRKWPR